MKILHCLSNWKWTERSELVIDLALAQSRLGHVVTLVCGKTPPDESPQIGVAANARQKGLDEIIATPCMTKHWHAFHTRRGVGEMRRIVTEKKPDVIHCHMRTAHLLAGLSRKKGLSPPLVRSVYNPENLSRDWISRWSYRRSTDGLIVAGRSAYQSALNAGFPPEKTAVIEPGIDLDRFSPERRLSKVMSTGGPNASDLHNFFVAGVVSRIRETRRLDIPLEAVSRLHHVYPRLRLLVVGRGRPGAYEQVVERPAQGMGISSAVIRAGYCRGDDLVAAYRCMQVLLYPVAGTDKTCRTVREALAAGVPVIASCRGFLRELVSDRETGYLVEPDPSAFAEALKQLLDFPEKQQAMSRDALSLARQRFSLTRQAKKTLAFYQKIMMDHPTKKQNEKK